MNDLAWIVALLSPRDIALHPNFRSQETVTAPSLLALLTTSQTGRFGQERDSDEISALLESDPLGMEVVDAVRAAMEIGTIAEGAKILDRIATEGPNDRLALRVSAAVVASSCYAELDLLDRAVRVLESLTATELAGDDDAMGTLLLSILSVNLALRARDIGGDSGTPAGAASDLLASLTVGKLPAVQLSRGVGWSSSTTMSNIVALLQESCALHLAEGDPDFKARLDLVRRPPGTLSQRRLGRAGAAIDKFMKNAFDEVAGTGSNTWSIEGMDGDEELTEGLFIAEFSGSPSASHQRTLLGTFRFLEGRSSHQAWQIREGLRLLRQGHSEKRLKPALRIVRREGPLDVLRDEAVQILRNRTESRQLGDLEAAVLGAGSDVLGPQTATRGVKLLLAMRLDPRGQSGGRWQHGGFWYEATVHAARQLSAAAELELGVIGEVLSDLEEERVPGPYDHMVARILPGFNLTVWSDASVQRQARALLGRGQDGFPESRRAIARQMELAAPPDAPIAVERPLTLMRLASVVDRSLVTGAAFPRDLVDEATNIVRDHMGQTKLAATKGQFTASSVYECDVAVALIFLTDAPGLWPAVVDFLCDPRVQRDDKSGALDRIVRFPKKVPAEAKEALLERVRVLLLGGPVFIGTAIDPYPSALGVAAVLDLVPREELLLQIGALVGSRKSHVRAEGVQILSAMASVGVEPAWLATTALLLTYDENILIRASATYALCRMRDTAQIGAQTVEDRVISLLGSDGVEVPYATLAGLQQAKRPLSSNVRKVISAMAASHASRTVRESAQSVLGKQA